MAAASASTCIPASSRQRASPTSASTRSQRGERRRTSPTPSAPRFALTEAATRLADRPDHVPDEVWDEAARHYDYAQLAALVIAIATINTWNRINATTRQITGEWVEQVISREPAGQAA